jgi:hypothetical protein
MIEEKLRQAADRITSFKNELKSGNRFFVDSSILTTFDAIINNYKKIIKQGTILYRGRINQFMNKDPLPDNEMGMPDNKILAINRANPLGINYLYLADDIDTVIAELRPNKDAYITIAEFNIIKDLMVVELSDELPYIDIDKTVFSFGILLGNEFIKSVNAELNIVEYLPTQYFSEYCKSKNFDGIKYLSGVTNTIRGFNYALFRQSDITCIRKEVRFIKNILYTHEKTSSG